MPKSYQIQCTKNGEITKSPNMDIFDAKAVFFDCQIKGEDDKIEMLHKGKPIFRAVKNRPTPILNGWTLEAL